MPLLARVPETAVAVAVAGYVAAAAVAPAAASAVPYVPVPAAVVPYVLARADEAFAGAADETAEP